MQKLYRGKMSNIFAGELTQLLLDNDNFLILTHTRPDADTLGSARALLCLLNALGKRARAVNPDRVSDKMRRLFGGYTYEDNGESYDFVISVDVAASTMLGDYAYFADEKKIGLMIDHHIPREPMSDKTYIFPKSAACGEIIYEIMRLFENLGMYKISPEAASYLYCAISADTGGFIFSNTTPTTHMIAAELLKHGFNAPLLDEALHLCKTAAQMKTEAFIMNGLQIYENGKIACATLTAAQREQFGVSEWELGEIVDIPRSLDGVEIAVFGREIAANEYKFSLRSRIHDISVIAALYNGGGHKGASGCTVHADTIEQARDGIISHCLNLLKAR